MFRNLFPALLTLCTLPFIFSCGEDPVQQQQNPLDVSKPGPYFVGNTSFIFEDTSRLLGCGEGNRRLVVEAWYPAANGADQWPQNIISDFFLNQLEAAVERFGEDGLVDYSTGSYRDAPLHPGAPPMPILIFSHGFSSNRFQNYTMANHLASHGYLVVAPDHTCNAMIAPLPDEAVFFSVLNAPFSIFQRVGDLRFLIDVFTGQTPEMFARRLDTTRIGIWGHSFGGWTVVETVKQEPRVSAVLQLAAFGIPGVPEDVDLPSMFLWGEEDKWMTPFESLHDQVIEEMPLPKYLLNFFNTGHFAFSDLCRFSPDLAENGNGCGTETRIGSNELFENPDPDTMHEILNPYATAFFGSVLFESPECTEYLASNRFPKRIEYLPVTE